MACSTAFMSPTGRLISAPSRVPRLAVRPVPLSFASAAMPSDAERASRFVWIEMRCRPLDQTDGADGAAEREVVAVLRDITQRKDQELALEQAHAKAEHANAGKSLIPRYHEPRAAHAAQRHHRLFRHAYQRLADDRPPAPRRIRASDQRVRPSPSGGGQRHSRHVEDRDRQFRDHAGAVRAGAGHRRLLPSADLQGARTRHRARGAICPPVCRRSWPTSARCTRSCSI